MKMMLQCLLLLKQGTSHHECPNCPFFGWLTRLQRLFTKAVETEDNFWSKADFFWKDTESLCCITQTGPIPYYFTFA